MHKPQNICQCEHTVAKFEKGKRFYRHGHRSELGKKFFLLHTWALHAKRREFSKLRNIKEQLICRRALYISSFNLTFSGYAIAIVVVEDLADSLKLGTHFIERYIKAIFPAGRKFKLTLSWHFELLSPFLKTHSTVLIADHEHGTSLTDETRRKQWLSRYVGCHIFVLFVKSCTDISRRVKFWNLKSSMVLTPRHGNSMYIARSLCRPWLWHGSYWLEHYPCTVLRMNNDVWSYYHSGKTVRYIGMEEYTDTNNGT